MKGVFRKVDDKTLVADSIEAMEALAAVHRGQGCMADVRGARNVDQHRLYWALCTLVAKATDSTKRGVSDFLLIACKEIEHVWWPNGEYQPRPKSLAFESMAQAEFAEFFNLAINQMAHLMGTERKELIARFNDMLDPEARRHFKKILRPVPSPSIQPETAEERERV